MEETLFNYFSLIEEFINSLDKEQTKQKIIIKMMKDSWHGKISSETRDKLLKICNVSPYLWQSYFFAYSLYKKYELANYSKEKITQ